MDYLYVKFGDCQARSQFFFFLGGSVLPFPTPLLPPLRSRAPSIQLGGLEERCKLPQRGL